MAPYAEATPRVLADGDPGRWQASACSLAEDLGLLRRPGHGRTSFPLDAVPRVLTATDWERLEAGLAQRVRALSAFVADAYGARRIVEAGVVPERVIETAAHYELHTAVGGLLARAIRAGTVGVVNAFGAGVGDDKLAHAYVEDMIRFYLGEDPGVRSVQTLDLGREDHLEQALDRFDELDPGQWVAQSLVDLSTHLTLIDGKLAPRHVDLRPFVFMHGPDEPHVMPGGLTRYASEEGAVIVNSTQNGGFKDTWVLDR